MKFLLPVFNSILILFIALFVLSCENSTEPVTTSTEGMQINHDFAKLSVLEQAKVENAKSKLHIAYGHTSHGSQLIDGMSGLVSFKGSLYSFSNGGTDGSLDLRNTPFSGASDLGNPDRIAWATATRNYLGNNPEINVIIWSWCGQVSSATGEDINIYLDLMSQLEGEFPGVVFVYMTGHLDGSGTDGNLHIRNEQIRNYCNKGNKFLFDFADIESYDPDGKYFLDRAVDDGCNYDSDGNGSRDANWATEWQNSHTENADWYNCGAAHSQPVNANMKAYAAWYLWCRIAEKL